MRAPHQLGTSRVREMVVRRYDGTPLLLVSRERLARLAVVSLALLRRCRPCCGRAGGAASGDETATPKPRSMLGDPRGLGFRCAYLGELEESELPARILAAREAGSSWMRGGVLGMTEMGELALDSCMAAEVDGVALTIAEWRRWRLGVLLISAAAASTAS